MKKFLSTIILLTMVLSATACSDKEVASDTKTKEQATTATEITTEAVTEKATDTIKEEIDGILKANNYEGIVYITKNNGEVLYQSATGVIEDKYDVTIDTSMPIGSISKQFCATSILMLRDQGKLTLDDKLSKYFPEYEIGKDITIKNLLSMRSGVLNVSDMEGQGDMKNLSADNTDEANTEIIKKWIFDKPLHFEPDTEMEYSNFNYFLLANIVEQVSGEKYIDFVRENIFKPVGMTYSVSIDEVENEPEWVNGVQFPSVEDGKLKGLTKGAGDIITNASDIDLWMNALKSGKVISIDSYNEMKTNYSPDNGDKYGYGYGFMLGQADDCVGHTGGIGTYISIAYFNEEKDYNLFLVSDNIYPQAMESMVFEITNKL